MEYPESINLCVENNPVNCLDDSCSDGWGWGALFAGTLGLVVANNMFSRAQKAPQYCVVNKENFFTQSEKDFVSQLWRYEKELICFPAHIKTKNSYIDFIETKLRNYY